MANEKKQKKNMTTARVFVKTLGLVTGRWVFSVFGLIAFVIIVAVGIVFSVHVWEFDNDAIIGVIVLFIIVGFIVYIVISKIGKTAYRNAQITEISYAFQHDEFLNKKINPLEVLNNRFEVASVFPMIIRTADLLLIMALKKKDREFVKNMKREWKKSFADFAACFLTGVVPILGFCSLSWFLQHPEDGVLKGACDGLYGIYINMKKIIKRMLFIFIIECIILVFIYIAVYIILVLALTENSFLSVYMTGIGGNYNYTGNTAAFVGCGIVAFVIVKFIPWLYIQSYGMISVLQIYTKATKENPPGTSPLYKRIMDKYNAVKQRKNDRQGKAESD